MSERDFRLVELDRSQAELDRVRENLDAVARWSDSFLPMRFAFDLREMRARLTLFLDERSREISLKRRAVEREIAEEGEGAQ